MSGIISTRLALLISPILLLLVFKGGKWGKEVRKEGRKEEGIAFPSDWVRKSIFLANQYLRCEQCEPSSILPRGLCLWVKVSFYPQVARV